MVRCEQDGCILAQSAVVKGFQQLTHEVVHVAHHGIVGPAEGAHELRIVRQFVGHALIVLQPAVHLAATSTPFRTSISRARTAQRDDTLRQS
jgi:orotidine-5'-phosphate decarboxylase